MKYISFTHNGKSSYGVLLDGRIVDLGIYFGDRAPDLKALIASGRLEQAVHAAVSQPTTLTLAGVSLLPVIPNPGQIICVGLNYADHVQETGRVITESPTLFLRVPQSQVGHGQDIVLPPESTRLDYEGEIAVIIGKGGRRISEADAWSHIAGYACYNDGSIRDWQSATSQFTPGKNFWRTGGFGPWMVPASEIAPGRTMTLVTRLNGVELQRATTDMMLHSIPRQIAYISTFTPLEPGDVIVTGTPGGVGFKRNPPVYMQHGDLVEVEVDAIGTLSNHVRDE
ncbi:fumarylacetoacetate hydrolase family protein [Polaromonas sp. P1(28)-13]|nr:fumarylacetoacetate hydrolase family protein [Polaromonas sp. P1-6]UUZ77715.1 fumarylacetoacetate hydrolase family protein [Polaromonas sp. P1(28)-13]